jgi:hypothetical protein
MPCQLKSDRFRSRKLKAIANCTKTPIEGKYLLMVSTLEPRVRAVHPLFSSFCHKRSDSLLLNLNTEERNWLDKSDISDLAVNNC